MKEIALITLMVFCSTWSVAQEPTNFPLEFGDVFVLDVILGEEIITDKCPCKKRTKCTLRKIEVSKVLYCPRNISFDSLELLNVNYILIERNKSPLKTDTSITITASPSGSKHYIRFARILTLQENVVYRFSHTYAYLSEITCPGKDLFEKHILSTKQ